MDGADNTATYTATYHVHYAFSGFDNPIGAPPTVNVGKAGRTYSLRWGLSDYSGTQITSTSAVSRIAAVKLSSCASFADDPTTVLEEVTTSDTGLGYDTDSQQFVFNWKTPKQTARGTPAPPFSDSPLQTR